MQRSQTAAPLERKDMISQQVVEFRNKIMARLPELKWNGISRVPQTQRFWDFYKINKQKFTDACLYVCKKDDVWVIIAGDLVDRESERAAKLEEMKAKHLNDCPSCFESLEICVSLMKNGVEQFKGYCPICFDIRTGALPHLLVEYLKRSGAIVIDRKVVYDLRGTGTSDYTER